MTSGAERVRLRILIMAMVAISFLSVLVLRLWFLQVLAYDEYSEAAQFNQVREVPIPAARGRILDRNGEILVRNRQSLVVSARPDRFTPTDDLLKSLGFLLIMTPEEITERLEDKRALPFAALPIKEDVPEEVIAYIREHQDDFPGVVTEIRPRRLYPYGGLAAHIVGYTGEITEDQLDESKYAGYRQGDTIGRSGVEESYERDLAGKSGTTKLRVDASGKTRGAPLGFQDPVSGSDLVTTIDLDLQRLTEESLRLGLEKARTIFDRETRKNYLAPAGGAVVMDPSNGQILAMASLPAYDASAFVGGISAKDFDALLNHPSNPLLNRNIQAEFPPGSTFKLVTAAAALQEGLAKPGGSYNCPASYRFADRTFRNWRSFDSGFISIVQAIVDSCDTVFYDFGAKFWQRFRRDGSQRLQDYSRAFGFDEATGIDLPFEQDGVIPDDDWLQEMNRRFPKAFPYSIWLPGYDINLSIGQGDLVVTPLQLANSYAAVANGGTVYAPRIGLKTMKDGKVVREVEGKVVRQLPVSAGNLATIRRGLEGVIARGTARGAYAGFPLNKVSVAGKTGTAELQTNPPSQPFAWFVAYAPAADPKFLVAVMLEEGGHGGETAAPIARRILEGAFDLPLTSLKPAARTD